MDFFWFITSRKMVHATQLLPFEQVTNKINSYNKTNHDECTLGTFGSSNFWKAFVLT
tara:strand:+ start:610 stop:780 length:171 start_codon:yes stop_codon:yes gene_type:complete